MSNCCWFRVPDPFDLKGSVFCYHLGAIAKEPIRIYGRGHLHFITFSCYQSLALLGSVRARKTFVEIFAESGERSESNETEF